MKDYYYDTSNENIGGKHYCSYCGKECIQRTEYDEHTPSHFYHCDCQDAQSEHEMNKQLAEIVRKYKHLKPNKEVINRLKFEYEVDQLRRRYNQK